ncbi:agmatine deiminase [Geomicrobium halophilum]|nr:agmatine deiminase [Geomicrobium halophilum]
MKTYNHTPKSDGYRMPGEFEPHDGTWLLWPVRPDTWHSGAKPAQRVFTNVAEAIAKFEPVTVCVPADQYKHVRAVLSPEIRVIEMSSNDAWMRDIGPIFLTNDFGHLSGVDFHFNAWGGLEGGLYFPWDQDMLVKQKVFDIERVPRYDATDLTLEGGAIAVDGEGTVITTKECLLNSNRNPDWTQEQVEERLKETLNVKKVIWLDQGMVGDETDGHIDEVLCYIRPGEVAMSWTDDQDHPQYPVLKQCKEQLQQATDAIGRALTIHEVSIPEQPVLQWEESQQLDQTTDSYERKAGEPCVATYVNGYICNGAVILPAFDDPMDQEAVNLFQRLFPEREIVPVQSRELSLAGGNIHCITQQQPQARVSEADTQETSKS